MTPLPSDVTPVAVLLVAALAACLWYIVRLRRANGALAATAHRLQQAEHALKANEQRFQDVAQASGDWFWETDARGRFTWLSDSVEAVTGVSPAWHYGKTRAELAAPGQLDAEVWQAHQALLARCEPFRDFRYVRRSPRGDQWMSTSGVPRFGDDGQFLGYRGAGSDISRQVHETEAARQANALLRAAIEEIDETFMLTDPQDRLVLANRSFRELNPGVAPLIAQGCSYEDYLRRACELGYIPESAGRVDAFVAERLARRREAGPPFERYRADGRCLLVRDRRLPDGCTVTVGVDITERKAQERALAASQRLLEQVIDALPMAIFAKDAASNYVLVNRHFAAFHGQSKEDFLHRHTSGLSIPSLMRTKSLADDNWVYQNRRPLDQPQARMQTPDGRWVSFHSSKIPLFDDDGELTGLLGINRDITEDLRAQAVLSASEARFAALFHNARVPQLVSHPAAGTIEDVNHAFCELLGQPAHVLIGAGGAGGEPLGQDLAVFCSAARTPATEAREIVLHRPDGSTRTVLGTAFTIDTAAGERVAWSLQDVTDQREAQAQMRRMNQTLERAVHQRTEQLTQANEELRTALHDLEASQEALLQSEKLAALGRIVAGVAHELNTPIGNSLLSATTLADQTDALAAQVAQGLRRSFLDSYVGTVRDVMVILLRNLERAAELIGSFKQLAADQASSQRRAFDLKTVVDEVLLSHRPTLRTHRIELRVEVPEGLALDGYPGPLGQVLGNLLDNAAIHGYEGREAGGLVAIRARRQDAGLVVLEVEDQGRGIEPASLRRIFDPFFTTRLGRGGSGLGLHIVHNIVTGALGGSVAVRSEPGQGACFMVTFPSVAPSKVDG